MDRQNSAGEEGATWRWGAVASLGAGMFAGSMLTGGHWTAYVGAVVGICLLLGGSLQAVRSWTGVTHEA